MARAQKRITKKELRQDPLMKAISAAEEMAPVYGRPLIIGVAVIVIAVFAVLIFRNMKQSSNEEAQVALSQARQLLAEDRQDLALNMLDEASERYRGTKGGADALFSLAEIKMANEEYEQALELFTKFEKRYGSEFMLNVGAINGKAAVLENLERYEEAANTYEILANKDSFGHLKPYALYSAARCWKLADNTGKAITLYKSIVEDYPEFNLTREVERELARLELTLEG